MRHAGSMRRRFNARFRGCRERWIDCILLERPVDIEGRDSFLLRPAILFEDDYLVFTDENQAYDRLATTPGGGVSRAVESARSARLDSAIMCCALRWRAWSWCPTRPH